MRRVVKGHEPEDLRRWKEENADAPQNLTYGNMPKAGVKAQMLIEQGYLCGYTMQRIQTVNDCHIEHVVPRNQPNERAHLDIGYENLLACVPSDTPGHRPQVKNFPYGACKKGGTHVDQNNFVSPLHENVEYRFDYLPDGSVEEVAGDEAARSTIAILALNHLQLVDLRKAAIEERVLDVDVPLSAEGAEALAQEIMRSDSVGKLPEFCLAISQVAAWYADKMHEIN